MYSLQGNAPVLSRFPTCLANQAVSLYKLECVLPGRSLVHGTIDQTGKNSFSHYSVCSVKTHSLVPSASVTRINISQSAWRDKRSIACHTVSQENIIWDTMPSPTTTDADSSIFLASFTTRVQRQDTLLGAFCATLHGKGHNSPCSQPFPGKPRHRRHSSPVHGISRTVMGAFF